MHEGGHICGTLRYVELRITYIHTKFTIQLASVGLPHTCPMLLTIIVGFHQLLILV